MVGSIHGGVGLWTLAALSICIPALQVTAEAPEHQHQVPPTESPAATALLQNALEKVLVGKQPSLQSLAVASRADGMPGVAVTVMMNGQPRTLLMEKHSVRSKDFQVLVQVEGNDTLVPTEPPPITTYKGFVQEEPETEVRGSLVGGKLTALVFGSGVVYGIQPVSDYHLAASDGAHVVYHSDGITSSASIRQSSGTGTGNGSVAGTGMQIADLAVDTNFPFYENNASDVGITVQHVERAINAAAWFFEQPAIGVIHEITTVVVRTSEEVDPYGASISREVALDLALELWNDPTHSESFVRRDVLLVLAAVSSPNGGLTHVDSVCRPNGISAVTFIQTNDLEAEGGLIVHELAHAWGAPAAHCLGYPHCAIPEIADFVSGLTCLSPFFPSLVTPFFDDFPTFTLNAEKWSYNHGARLIQSTPAAIRACCLPSSDCVEVDGSCCTSLGGTPRIADTTCASSRACCLPNGLCVNLDPDCCTDQGGTSAQEGAMCTGNASPEGCCLEGGTCLDLSPFCCGYLGGVTEGTGTFCTEPQCCGFSQGKGHTESLDPLCCADRGGQTDAYPCPDDQRRHAEVVPSSNDISNGPDRRASARDGGVHTFASTSPNAVDTNAGQEADRTLLLAGACDSYVELNASGPSLYQNDDLRTGFIDLSSASTMWLSYKYKWTGVEVGESLVVEYRASSNRWREIARIPASVLPPLGFFSRTHILPADAYHNEFRVRFRSEVNEPNDVWLINDVKIDNTCVTSANCNDGLYCNGTEACASGACQVGTPPCSGTFCNEQTDSCSATCSQDSQCNDSVFCNGVETCSTSGATAGTCQPGTDPCAGNDYYAACDESYWSCRTPLCEPPIVTAEGCRYLAVTPAPSTLMTVALKESPDSCNLWQYVQDNGALGGILPAFYQTPMEWGTVFVNGASIAPNTTYRVQTVCSTGGNASVLRYATTPIWGDVNGSGIVDVDDLLCVLDGYLDDFTNCSMQEDDLMPCTPDGIIDIDDVNAIFDALSEVPYPCAAPCP